MSDVPIHTAFLQYQCLFISSTPLSIFTRNKIAAATSNYHTCYFRFCVLQGLPRTHTSSLSDVEISSEILSKDSMITSLCMVAFCLSDVVNASVCTWMLPVTFIYSDWMQALNIYHLDLPKMISSSINLWTSMPGEMIRMLSVLATLPEDSTLFPIHN